MSVGWASTYFQIRVIFYVISYKVGCSVIIHIKLVVLALKLVDKPFCE